MVTRKGLSARDLWLDHKERISCQGYLVMITRKEISARNLWMDQNEDYFSWL
jgi:hypothetical protein